MTFSSPINPNDQKRKQLSVSSHLISAYLDANAKNYAHFIDFTSTFNTLDPGILISDLVDAQLNPHVINTIYSFLTNRSQREITRDSTSLLSTSIGSPQGCVLSRLLFSIYVQHVPSRSAKSFHLLKYADDTVLIELLHSNEPSSLQQASESLVNWCNDSKLIIKVSKTMVIFFIDLNFTASCDHFFLITRVWIELMILNI